MNHLAHLLLADPFTGGMTGQIAGDFVKGRDLAALHGGVAAGIRKHRRLDSFSDAHPAVQQAKTLFASPGRRYAGVALDLVFDHLLSRHWGSYCPLTRRDFLNACQQTLWHERPLWPLPMQRFTEHMLREQWLDSYADWWGVQCAAERLVRARAHRRPLLEAMDLAKHHLSEIELLFQSLMPDLLERFSATEAD